MAHQHHVEDKRSHHKDRTQSRIVLAVLQVEVTGVTARDLGAVGLVRSPAREKTGYMSGVLNVIGKYRAEVLLFRSDHWQVDGHEHQARNQHDPGIARCKDKANRYHDRPDV